jgi:hypothetical protein
MFHQIEQVPQENLKLKLMGEAVAVGVGLIPIFVITEDLFPKMPKWGHLLIAGGSFHLLCEYSGLNNWYLDNGVASKQRYSDVYSSYHRQEHWADTHRYRNSQYY